MATLTIHLGFPPAIRITHEVTGTVEVHHVHAGEVRVLVEMAELPAVGGTLTHGPIERQP